MNSPRCFAFGPFLLIPERQLLLRRDAVVRIGCRAFDLLIALVERPGELVTKAELMARAWPRTVVEEANLKVNMSVLRRALGDGVGTPDYIATVPGRGYRFVASVQANPLPTPALTFSDIQLFVDSAAYNLASFNLSDAEAPRVAEIRRKLDDIALAIELTRRALKPAETPDC